MRYKQCGLVQRALMLFGLVKPITTNSIILFLKNSDMLNVDLNAKDHEGGTAFHYACSNGQLKLAKLLMKNSIEFNIELEHIDNDGRLVSNSDY